MPCQPPPAAASCNKFKNHRLHSRHVESVRAKVSRRTSTRRAAADREQFAAAANELESRTNGARNRRRQSRYIHYECT